MEIKDKEIETWDDWEKLSDEKKVHAIMEKMAEHWNGEAYQIRWDHVIHAEVSDDHFALLTVQPIKEWIEENEMWVTDDLDE